MIELTGGRIGGKHFSYLLGADQWCRNNPRKRYALVDREGALILTYKKHDDHTLDECCAKIKTETIQSCLKQVSDKWAKRCARAELRCEQLRSTIRRMKAARKRERAKRHPRQA